MHAPIWYNAIHGMAHPRPGLRYQISERANACIRGCMLMLGPVFGVIHLISWQMVWWVWGLLTVGVLDTLINFYINECVASRTDGCCWTVVVRLKSL